ncbi:Uncharacterised protein [Shigella sonnei]|nr:Uncharacterised protein [Shigella sonnei]
MHDSAQLFFAQRAANHDIGFDTHHAHQHTGDSIQQPDQRHHQNLQRSQQKTTRISDFFRVQRGNGFRQYLSKYQYDKSQHTSRNCHARIAVQTHPNNSAERGGKNIDQVIAD